MENNEQRTMNTDSEHDLNDDISKNILKITISKKRLFMENVQNFIRRYRESTVDFANNGKIHVIARGGTISIGFSVIHCVIDSWCKDLEIETVNSYVLSDDLLPDSSVSRKIQNYQNNIVAEIVLIHKKDSKR